jgi:2-polyprenyl-3-methyl-5-hydroxy-6-metoxy-1,4-benzoquinol methylase
MAENAPVDGGRVAWNAWNAAHREASQDRVSREQTDVVEEWLRTHFLGQELRILDVGCGTGWMSERLSRFGQVTAIDIADEVLERARIRAPQVDFITADFLETDLGASRFDVVVALESLSHVADQSKYLKQIATVLRPGGSLMLATQNRPVMERNIRRLRNPGYYQHWFDRHELRAMLNYNFVIDELRSITPVFPSGPLHMLNSSKLERMVGTVGLGRPLRWIKHLEENMYLGWTLMCHARARPARPPAIKNDASTEWQREDDQSPAVG